MHFKYLGRNVSKEKLYEQTRSYIINKDTQFVHKNE